MAAQYFIKRGKTVKGPFSVEKLQALKKAKKLKADDAVSQSRKGPWDRLGVVYKSILKEDRVDDYEDDVLFYEDDDDGYEDDDDGYVDPPPPRRKQSKSTKVKRSSQHKKQSSGKLPLIIVGCFLGVGLVGAGVYGVIAIVAQNGLADTAGTDLDLLPPDLDRNAVAKAMEGVWMNRKVIQEPVRPDGSRIPGTIYRMKLILNPDKNDHGQFFLQFSEVGSEEISYGHWGDWTILAPIERHVDGTYSGSLYRSANGDHTSVGRQLFMIGEPYKFYGLTKKGFVLHTREFRRDDGGDWSKISKKTIPDDSKGPDGTKEIYMRN